MQFGIFSIADITPDPTTGRIPTEHERLEAIVEYATLAEQVGLDVFALGEHHNPPFVTSSPTTTLGYVAGRTSEIILSTATTLITIQAHTTACARLRSRSSARSRCLSTIRRRSHT